MPIVAKKISMRKNFDYTHFFYREHFFSEESEMFSMRFRLSVSGYVLYSKKRSLCSESESEMFSIFATNLR